MATPQEIRDRITITPESRAVTVRFHGAIIASTREALRLEEKGYDPVFYIPRDRVETAFLHATQKRTTCPYKGEASYWSISAEGRAAENAVWSYETPHDGVREIADAMAFRGDGVQVETDGTPA